MGLLTAAAVAFPIMISPHADGVVWWPQFHLLEVRVDGNRVLSIDGTSCSSGMGITATSTAEMEKALRLFLETAPHICDAAIVGPFGIGVDR